MFGKKFLVLMVLFLFPLVSSCGGGSGSGDGGGENGGNAPAQVSDQEGISLTADPVEVVRGGPSLITASLGDEVANKASRPVSFELTINPSGGAIESADRATDEQGTARAVYRAGRGGGIDVVRVRIPPHGDATVNIKVFDADPPRQSLTIKADPDEVGLEGVSTITATLMDKDGPVPGVGGGFSFVANRSGARLSVTDRSTDVNGNISAHYRAGRRAGVDVIQASFPPSIAATVNITVGEPTLLITISPSTLPQARQFEPYNALLTASGGRPGYTFSVEPGSTMPPGVNLNPNGVISGTPTTAGSFTFVVRVDDTAGNRAVAERTVNVVSPPPPSPLTIESSDLTAGIVGQPYNHQLEASGGRPPYFWDLPPGSLPPPGLTLDPSGNGIVTGRPTAAGTFNFVVRVRDLNGDRVQNLISIDIAAN